MHREFFEWFDPTLAARIEWLPLNKLTCIEASQYDVWNKDPSGTRDIVANTISTAELSNVQVTHGKGARLISVQYTSNFQNVKSPPRLGSSSSIELRITPLIQLVATEAMRIHSRKLFSYRQPSLIPKKAVIFYRRQSSGTRHGRTMSIEHETHLFSIIRKMLSEFDRSEEFVVYNGDDDQGATMSFQSQFELFSRASLVVGPHGEGLANLVWVPPATDESCGVTKPAVLELICSTETSAVQTGCPGKSLWSLLAGLPWVQYYHVLLARNSTADPGGLFVDLGEFEEALRVVFSNMT